MCKSSQMAVNAAIFLLAGCTARGPFRTTYPGMPFASGSKEDTRMVENHGRYQIAFVEFDDNGKRQEGKKQLEAAVGLIRKARGLNPATGKVESGTVGGMTILYIHAAESDRRTGHSADEELRHGEEDGGAATEVALAFGIALFASEAAGESVATGEDALNNHRLKAVGLGCD